MLLFVDGKEWGIHKSKPHSFYIRYNILLHRRSTFT